MPSATSSSISLEAVAWEKRIGAKIDALPLKDIEIKEYVRDTNLANLSTNIAYRVDGVHLYADILI